MHATISMMKLQDSYQCLCATLAAGIQGNVYTRNFPTAYISACIVGIWSTADTTAGQLTNRYCYP